ncbi:HNH endonuclease [Streptomyces sp. PA03-6a]|nr:HNH endonuclease [Streptomyces sp. PA03-6a]
MARRRTLRPEDRRSVRRSLAARDGAQCRYCQRPFPDLAEATLDHVIPYSIWRTWRQRNLVLACEPCNKAKGDSLPLIVALLVLRNVRLHPEWRQACTPTRMGVPS